MLSPRIDELPEVATVVVDARSGEASNDEGAALEPSMAPAIAAAERSDIPLVLDAPVPAIVAAGQQPSTETEAVNLCFYSSEVEVVQLGGWPGQPGRGRAPK